MFRDRAILLLAFGQTLVWAGLYYVFPASLVRWEAALGWSKPDLTLAITMAVLASALCAPLAGRVIDAGRGPQMMGLSAALGGLGVMALSAVSELWQFHAIWLGIGVCLAGALYEPCFAMVTRARGAEARRGIVLITLVAGFAGTVSFPTVHFLSEAVGWRMAMQLIGGFVALVVAPVLWFGAVALGPDAAVAGVPPGTAASRSHLRRPVFWLLGLAFAFMGITHGAILHHLLPMLAERGVASGQAVLAASAIGPMQVVGRLGMVAAQRRLDNNGFALLAFAGVAASAAILLVAGASPALVGLAVVLFGASYGTISILRPVIARDLLGGANFGAKSGGLALMYLTASAMSAWVGALIWRLGGYGLMLSVLIGLAAAGAMLYLAARTAARRDDQARAAGC